MARGAPSCEWFDHIPPTTGTEDSKPVCRKISVCGTGISPGLSCFSNSPSIQYSDAPRQTRINQSPIL
ncbi:hypothetical protein CY34DRAFT_804300 [Suillus luteus UH-Slu-Lm8-n1]|uniref:Uncharacterized protein n=1 Tax=Suillus luteus UH-Slu-Lm8-n1 TaxID=930992 RepID=A0A0D0BII5_9AGAM|nr:hypothetical protein CY34DRAFT_804300 [Suillus luteus UH-Slu-Lm8-n1]